MRMPSSSLHRSCDSLVRSVSFCAGFFQPMRFFQPLSPPLPPPLPHCPSPQALFLWVLQFLLFSPCMFSSVMGACTFPFVWGLMAGLRCTVVPVMGALIQSSRWLPIVEAPGYSRHPTSILAMQLLRGTYNRLLFICLFNLFSLFNHFSSHTCQ